MLRVDGVYFVHQDSKNKFAHLFLAQCAFPRSSGIVSVQYLQARLHIASNANESTGIYASSVINRYDTSSMSKSTRSNGGFREQKRNSEVETDIYTVDLGLKHWECALFSKLVKRTQTSFFLLGKIVLVDSRRRVFTLMEAKLG